MAARKCNHRKAFTLVEVLVSAMAAVILIVGLSAMLFYGQRGYNTMYRRVNSEVVRNAYEARRVFDAIVRKSIVDRCDIFLDDDEVPSTIYLYYYYDETAPIALDIPVDRYRYMYPDQPNRFARFYVTNTDVSEQLELYVERGLIPLGTDLFATDPDPPFDPTFDPTSIEGTGTSMLLAKHVDEVLSCRFRNTWESSVQMVLTLNDEDDPASTVHSDTQTLKMVVTSRAIRHNKVRQ